MRIKIHFYRQLLRISLVAGVASIGASVVTQAQTVDSAAAAKLDFLNDRLNAMLAAGPGGLVTSNFFVPRRIYANTAAADASAPSDGKLKFSFNLTLPVNWDSNVNSLPSGGTSALEFSPDLHLAATDHFAALGGVSISGAADVVFTRYSNSAGSSGSPASYNFEIQHVSSKNDQEFQPFIAFSSQTAYNSDFSTDAGTVRKVYGGFDKVWDYGYPNKEPNGAQKLKRDPTDQQISSPFVSLQYGLSAQVGRSFATSSPGSTYLKVAPSVGYNFNNGAYSDGHASHWSISLGADITRWWRDAGTVVAAAQQPVAERDWAISPVLTVLYSPPLRWFKGEDSDPARMERNATHLGSPTITLQIAYEHFSSNIPGKSFSEWAIGPSLGASWNF